MSEEQANNYFIAHLVLESELQSIPDIPRNKKMRDVVRELSVIFRYKWMEEKARCDMEFHREGRRKVFLNLRDKILRKQRKKK